MYRCSYQLLPFEVALSELRRYASFCIAHVAYELCVQRVVGVINLITTVFHL